MDPMCQQLLLEVGANFLVWLLLGAILGLIVLLVGRRRVEAAVRVSEARFRTLVEASVDGIAIVDRTGTITYVSPGYERMVGYSAAELVGRSYADLLHPDDLAAAAGYVATLTSDPEHRAFAEVRLRRKDGAWRVVESSGRLLPDGQLVGYSRDLTELRSSQAALRELNATLEQRVAERTSALEGALAESRRLTAIFEATSDLVAMATLDGRLLYLNQNGRAMVGLAPDADLATLSFSDFYPPEALRQIAEEMLPRAAAQGSVLYETVLQHRDGHVIPVSIVGIVHQGSDGRPERLSAVARDISERKQIEAELHAAKEAAETASRAKSTFLATMSHEIRTPMNAVIGMTGLLLNTSLDARQRYFVETIRSAGDALLAVINDILDFSKIEAGRLELEQQPFDLRACVESAVDLLASRAEEQGLDLIYTVADDVPSGILGDAARLRQVLVNLLANAVKFTARGEVVLSVEAVAAGSGQDDAGQAQGAMLRFVVRDTGIGIGPEQLPRLFQSFSQIDPSTTRVFGGTGLGLAISRRLAELMGGVMWAVSDGPGHGASFSFTIVAPPAALPTRPQLRQRRPELSGLRALIVDDTPTNLRILSLQLQTWGLYPVEATTPGQALALLDEGEPFDLAILDMDLPEMDGATLAAAIQARPGGRDLPMLMLTSIGQTGAEPCMQLFVACLSKPVKPSQLYDALASIFAEGEPSVSWPAQDADATSAAPLLAERLPLRILVAEDVAVNQKFALLALEDLGYRADIAANGLEVLTALTRQPYDVVLMDVQMPELDGLEAARRTRQLWQRPGVRPTPRRPYIVAMTANALQGDRELCLAAGMDDYIAKPVYLEELRAALERAGASIGVYEPEFDEGILGKLMARPRGREIVGLYAEESLRLIAQAQTAVTTGDAAGLRDAAHSLKGSSRYLGAVRVAELSAALEQRGRGGDLAEARVLLAKLAEAHRRALARLTEVTAPHPQAL